MKNSCDPQTFLTNPPLLPPILIFESPLFTKQVPYIRSSNRFGKHWRPPNIEPCRVPYIILIIRWGVAWSKCRWRVAWL